MPPALPEVVDSISAEGSWSLLMSAATVQGHNARSFLSLPQERVILLGFAHRTMRASHSHLLTRPWPGKSFPTIPKMPGDHSKTKRFEKGLPLAPLIMLKVNFLLRLEFVPPVWELDKVNHVGQADERSIVQGELSKPRNPFLVARKFFTKIRNFAFIGPC